MRGNQYNEFAGGDDFGLLPKPWEMAQVARHKIIGSGSIRAFQEDVVIRIARDLNPARRENRMRAVFDPSEELLPKALPDLELRAR